MIDVRDANRILNQKLTETTVLEGMQLIEFIQEAPIDHLAQLNVPRMIVESRD